VLLDSRVVTGAAMELAQAEVAVSDEGAHPKLLGQGQGLSIAALGAHDIRRVGLRGDLAEGAEAPCLEAALTALGSSPTRKSDVRRSKWRSMACSAVSRVSRR
jgi:hypothetical protein